MLARNLKSWKGEARRIAMTLHSENAIRIP
jgi:hypothetical protein